MKNRKNIKYLLLILCILILIIPWGYIFDVQDEISKGNIQIFQRTAALLLLIPIVVAIIYKVFRLKTLKQEIKDEVNRKDTEKEQQFGPSLGQILFFVFFISMGIYNLLLPRSNGEDKGFELAVAGMSIFIAWLWYRIPVFIFTKNSLQIESSLFYFFHIDIRKTIRYEDILSAKIDRVKGVPYALYTLVIFTETEKIRYPLSFSDDVTAKIYICFKGKINERIKSL